MYSILSLRFCSEIRAQPGGQLWANVSYGAKFKLRPQKCKFYYNSTRMFYNIDKCDFIEIKFKGNFLFQL